MRRMGIVGWVVVVLAVYVGLVAATRRGGVEAEGPMPWWSMPSAGAVHATLGAVLATRGGLRAWLSGTFALCGAHLALGGLAAVVLLALDPVGVLDALHEAMLGLAWAPMMQAVGAALIVLPLRGGPSSPDPDERVPLRLVGAAPPDGGSPLAPAPPRDGIALTAPADGAGARLPSAAARAPIAPGAGAIRVSYERVMGQLPALAFSVPLELVGTRLQVAEFLLVPRDAVLPHLAEGFAVVDWHVVADQFPGSVFAVPKAAVGEAMPRGRLLLPIDEVVGQLPIELFESALSPLDLTGLEDFPAPFPDRRADERAKAEAPLTRPPASPALAPPAPAPVLALAVASSPSPRPAVMAQPPRVEVERVAAPVLATQEVETPAPLVDAPGAEIVPAPRDGAADAAAVPEVLAPPPAPDELLADPAADLTPAAPIVPCVAPVPLTAETEESADPRAEALVPAPPTSGAVTLFSEGPAPGAEPVRAAADSAEGRRLAARVLAAPVAELSLRDSRRIAGVTVHMVATADASLPDLTALAEAILPVLDGGRCPWPLEQVTLRNETRAIVLTLIGPLAAGGPVVLTEAPPRGALALLGLRARRAAAEWRADRPAAAAGPRFDAALLDALEPAAGEADLAAVAEGLGAFGKVEPLALRDDDFDVHCFAPRGVPAGLLAAFAAGLARALGRAEREHGVPRLDALTLEASDLRAVIRRLGPWAGRETLLIAGGGPAAPAGRACREVARAAATLTAAGG